MLNANGKALNLPKPYIHIHMDSFILRQINSKRFAISNQMIGGHYSVVRRHDATKPLCPEAMEEHENWELLTKITGVKEMGGKHYDSCWGFVQYEGDEWPLYDGFHYYIMTGNGQTFEHLKPH